MYKKWIAIISNTSQYSIPLFPISHTDFRDFTGGQVIINPPGTFEQDALSVLVHGDDIFEPQEYLEVSLRRPRLDLPDPFKSLHTNDSDNRVEPPDDTDIVYQFASTVIIIRGGNVYYMY